ncbi:DUF1877 family protein [Crossiella sp. CA198]|uniref:DUF1877 family protein n=1 Tax=Crossiella sp. CA198 TaxID=3455607 RepID=UPI003F8D3128
MAVTQQLARIPAALLTTCRHSVPDLDRVCSFQSAPPEDHLDLDWWPAALKATWTLLGTNPDTLGLLHRAFDGDQEVNPAYRDAPDTIWEHPVTALEPDRVAEVAAALHTITAETIRSAVSANRDLLAAAGVLPDPVVHPAEPLAATHAALQSFLAQAAHRRLAIVQWWD